MKLVLECWNCPRNTLFHDNYGKKETKTQIDNQQHIKFNPLSPSIHIQILPTFPYISLKN